MTGEQRASEVYKRLGGVVSKQHVELVLAEAGRLDSQTLLKGEAVPLPFMGYLEVFSKKPIIKKKPKNMTASEKKLESINNTIVLVPTRDLFEILKTKKVTSSVRRPTKDVKPEVDVDDDEDIC